jgi:hypothetical protein
MAKNEPATPEQQLLKLIEGQGKPGSDAAGAPARGGSASGGKGKGRSFSFSKFAGGLKGSFSFWKRRQKRKAHSRSFALGLAEVNKALVAATALLCLYVVFDAAASARSLQRPPNFAPAKDAKPKALKEMVAPLEETSYYLQKVSSRDIFREGKKEPEPVQEAAPQGVTVVEDAQQVQNLALVGISWSSNPDCIIEDKSKQRTYFVKRGQEVGDGVKVEAIFKDHVVVTFEDREYELR